MSLNYIRALFSEEYNDFDDILLIESAFTEIDESGKGIRYVHLGITMTKLIIASDNYHTYMPYYKIWNTLDMEIKTSELTAVYPTENITVEIYPLRDCTLRITFGNAKRRYFCLTGCDNIKMVWNSWCENIKYMIACTCQRKMKRYSFLSAPIMVDNTLEDISDYYIMNKMVTPRRQKWKTKDLYFGKLREIENMKYKKKPIMGIGQTVEERHQYFNTRDMAVSMKLDDKPHDCNCNDNDCECSITYTTLTNKRMFSWHHILG